MIYFDNSATTLQKPPQVAKATCEAIQTLGNAGRSFYTAAMQAGRTVYKTRAAIAGLAGVQNPLQVAFTSSATESLNLVVQSLVSPSDDVITTVLEHNSVLRPLYRSRCTLSFLNCDDEGRLLLEDLPKLLTPKTKFIFCTHGSNLVGSISNLEEIYSFCRQNGLTLVADISQTFGQVPVCASHAHVLCFTGHKALMGPQGTGGIIAQEGVPFKVVKTGGTGSDSFAKIQAEELPGVFEAGTENSHGLAGLCAAVDFLNKTGIENIQKKELGLTRFFLEEMIKTSGVTVYGPHTSAAHLPVIALTIQGLSSEDVSLRLWEEYEIATRAGSHCAPLAHQRFDTVQQGMVRFSFGYFNTFEEVEIAVAAVRRIASSA